MFVIYTLDHRMIGFEDPNDAKKQRDILNKKGLVTWYMMDVSENLSCNVKADDIRPGRKMYTPKFPG